MIRESDWYLTGEDLCKMHYSEFKTRIPFDPANLFWTHIDLLQKNRKVFVQVIKTENDETSTQPSTSSIKELVKEEKTPANISANQLTGKLCISIFLS